MVGILQFALGLNSSQFNSAAQGAQGKLTGLKGAASGLGGALAKGFQIAGTAAVVAFGAIGAGVASAIKYGGDLTDLSNRTGETIENLVGLQHAFGQSGVSAETATGIITKLQKSLSGVGDMGEDTTVAFKALGLDINELRKTEGPQALVKVMEKLRGLSKNDAAGAAAKIFGREGGGSVLQAARDMESFTESLLESQKAGAVIARTAGAFDKIGDTVGTIKIQLKGMFAGIGEGLAPMIQSILNAVKGIDFVGIGEKIGGVLGAIGQAVKDGEIGELIYEALAAGFEKAFNFVGALLGDAGFWKGLLQGAVGAFAELGIVLLKVFETPLTYLQVSMDAAVQNAMESLGAIPGVGSALGLSGFTAQSTDELLAERQASGVSIFGMTIDEMKANLGSLFQDGAKTVGQSFKDAAEASGGPMGDKFVEHAARLEEKFRNGLGKAANNPPGADPNSQTGQGRNFSKGGATDGLTRIGFFSSGGGGTDPATKTASNTLKAVELARTQVQILNRILLGMGITPLKNA